MGNSSHPRHADAASTHAVRVSMLTRAGTGNDSFPAPGSMLSEIPHQQLNPQVIRAVIDAIARDLVNLR
jgi:hypothetical protein